VVLFLDSLNVDIYSKAITNGHFNEFETMFTAEEKHKYRWNCQGPGTKDRAYHCLTALLTSPLTQKKKNMQKNERKPTVIHPNETFLLNISQLYDNDFPVSNSEDKQYHQFIELDDLTTDNTSGLSLVALDCEMCQTTVGLELTRISIVDDEENLIFDELVKPANPITDYLTQWSGIAESDLEGVTTTLKDVQQQIKQWLTKNTILVGHSLENDLKALKIFHCRVADTSVLFPHTVPGSKNSLKFLASKYLSLQIQDSSHDSTQDSITALRLFKLKKERGPLFGKEPEKYETLFDVLSRSNKKSVYIDSVNNLNLFGGTGTASLIPVTSDAEVVSRTVSQLKNNEMHFIVSRLNSVTQNLHETPDATFQEMTQHISQILSSLPQNSLLIAFSGPGHTPKETEELTRAKRSGFGICRVYTDPS